MPVSLHLEAQRVPVPPRAPAIRTLMSIQPSEVNLIALLTKLLRIWRRRTGSTRSAGADARVDHAPHDQALAARVAE